MAWSNYSLGNQIEASYPHTFRSMQKLVMAMADYKKNRGKTGMFGQDKGLKAFNRFELELKNTLNALLLDGELSREMSDVRKVEALLKHIATFAQAFPNWQDAYSFANEYFVDNALEAKVHVSKLI